MNICHATIRFYAGLNDFLPLEKRKQSFNISFSPPVSIKDVIESMGVPHTEIAMILVNGVAQNFDYRLCHSDYVSVYPPFKTFDISCISPISSYTDSCYRFVCDVHLGKTARYLRILGFDTLYRNDYPDTDIVEIAFSQKRIVLSRDRGLLKHKKVLWGYLVRSTQVTEQLLEIIERFDLNSHIKLFSRCSYCNGHIDPVDKKKVAENLKEKTKQYYSDFFKCVHCEKIYWQGAHVKTIKEILVKWGIIV